MPCSSSSPHNLADSSVAGCHYTLLLYSIASRRRQLRAGERERPIPAVLLQYNNTLFKLLLLLFTHIGDYFVCRPGGVKCCGKRARSCRCIYSITFQYYNHYYMHIYNICACRPGAGWRRGGRARSRRRTYDINIIVRVCVPA